MERAGPVKRVGGVALVILGWSVVVWDASALGAIVAALFHMSEVRLAGLFLVDLVVVVAAVVGYLLIKVAWRLLGTPAGSAGGRAVLGFGLLVVTGLSFVLTDARSAPSRPEMWSDLVAGSRVAIAVLGLALLLSSRLQSQGARRGPVISASMPPPPTRTGDHGSTS